MEAVKTENIDTQSIGTEIISPKKYLRIHDKDQHTIKDVEFIRPKIGEKHFGKFRVTYNYPTFKPIDQRK